MIIGVCGRVAAGKETLTSFLRDKGFVYFETRQIIVEELKKLGLELSRENMQNWADKLREKEGVEALMKVMLSKTEKGKNYLFDSLRNSGEAEFLKKQVKNFVLIGVDASQNVRFNRMVSRGKPSDPKTWEEFLKMDARDNFDSENPMGQQTGRLLEMADHVIVNDKDLAGAIRQVEDVYNKILKPHS